MIQLKNFSLYVEERVLIENINYSFSCGKVIGFYGESGKGKSTFLKALVGLHNDYKGEIIYDNNFNVDKSFYKNNIFYCSTENKLFENNTVIENIKILTSNNDNVDYYVNKYNLNKIANQKVKYCSLGEKQKVLLCICFINNKKINLLDETLCNLDFQTLNLIKKEIKMKSQDSLFIIISHSIKDIEDICDEIIDFNNFNNINKIYKEEKINWENKKNKSNCLLIKNDYNLFKKIILSTLFVLLFLIAALLLNMVQSVKSYAKEIIKSDNSICFISSKNIEETNYFYIETSSGEIFNLIILDELYLNDKHVTIKDDEVILSKSLYSNHQNQTYNILDYKLNVKDIYYEDDNLDYHIIDSIDISFYKTATIVNTKTFYNIFYTNYGLFLTEENALVKLDKSLDDSQCVIESKYDYSSLTKIKITTGNLSLDVIKNNQVENIRMYDKTYPYLIIYVNENNFEIIKNNIIFDINKLFNQVTTAKVFSTSSNIDLVYDELKNNNDNVHFTLRKTYEDHMGVISKNQIVIYVTLVISILSALSFYIYLKFYQKNMMKKIEKTMDNYFINNTKKSVYKVFHTNLINILNIILALSIFVVIHNILFAKQIYYYSLKYYLFCLYVVLLLIEIIDSIKMFKKNNINLR